MSLADAPIASPETALEALTLVPARRLSARVSLLLKTATRGDFNTFACDSLELTMEGIAGDRHGGFTRRSGGREPYYPRGTEMCNERQLSILASDELALVARRMELDRIEPGWIGGNIVLDGIANLSLLPPRTRLVFEGGAVVRIDGDNAPCRAAGKSIAGHFPEREGLDLAFPKQAVHLRGLVGYVEKAGVIASGEGVIAHLPPQWIYGAAS